MGKKNKNKNQIADENQSYETQTGGDDFESPVPFPDKFDTDFLATLDDEDLHGLGRSLNDAIGHVGRYGLNPYLWEVEMCYVQREMHMRTNRRAAHAAWLSGGASTELN